MKPMPDATEHLLNYERVAAMLPVGAHHVQMDAERDYMNDRIAMVLTAAILTEQGGPTVTEKANTTFRFATPVRPRWLPKFLWRRIPWQDLAVQREVSVTLTPRWKYPHAEQVAPLGEGLRYVTMPQISWRDFVDPDTPIAPR